MWFCEAQITQPLAQYSAFSKSLIRLENLAHIMEEFTEPQDSMKSPWGGVQRALISASRGRLADGYCS